ncbi:MAG: hypothetical protein LBK77_07340, partial [Spirochaetaceae bacterium]|nr:hypothetical protein [Spirochaetaceae bacterium]
AEIKKRLAGKPALAAKAFKDLDSELALAGAKAPRLFFLGLAVRELFSRYAPGRINPVLLRHPSEQGGTFFEVNRPILAAIGNAEAPGAVFGRRVKEG